MQKVDYAAAVQDMNAAVVFSTELAGPVTRAQALALFNTVAHMENWKLPVDCELSYTELVRLGGVEAMRKAVEFFTGSTCRVDDCGGSARVRAAGYYAACGA